MPHPFVPWPWFDLPARIRENRKVLSMSGPVAQLGARFHGMEEVIGSIPIRSTKQPLTNQAYAGRRSLPPLGDFVSFCVTRSEGLRRLLTSAAVEADSFEFFLLRASDFLSSKLMELIVDCTLAGISCI